MWIFSWPVCWIILIYYREKLLVNHFSLGVKGWTVTILPPGVIEKKYLLIILNKKIFKIKGDGKKGIINLGTLFDLTPNSWGQYDNVCMEYSAENWYSDLHCWVLKGTKWLVHLTLWKIWPADPVFIIMLCKQDSLYLSPLKSINCSFTIDQGSSTKPVEKLVVSCHELVYPILAVLVVIFPCMVW